VLICAVGPGLHMARCDQDRASDVIGVPQSFASPPACFFGGQAFLAAVGVGQFDTRIYQAKIVCMPERAGRELAKARRTKPRWRTIS
jgi:hypothetical protein